MRKPEDFMPKTNPATRPIDASLFARTSPWTLALVVLFIGWCATALFWWQTQQDAARQKSAVLELSVDEATRRLIQELGQQELLLKGFRGLFNSSSYVSRFDFRRYYDSLALSSAVESRPVIRTVAYHELVPREELEAHRETLRREGFPEYRVFPERDKALYAPLVYIEPFTQINRDVLGFDPLEVDAERRAIERARDTGQMSLSQKLVLAQDGARNEPGFVMYIPIYRYGFPSANSEQRLLNFIGWVDAPIRIADLYQTTFPNGLQDLILRIYDGGEPTPDRLFFQSESVPEGVSLRPGSARIRMLSLGGHQWRLEFHPLPSFGHEQNGAQSLNVILIGILLSLILATTVFLVFNWYRQRAAQTLSRAREMDAENRRQERLAAERELIRSEERFRSLMENIASVAVQGYRLDGTVTFWNAASEQLYGYSKAEALGSNLYSLIIPEAIRPEVEQAILTMARTGESIPSGELQLRNQHGDPVTVFSSHALVASPSMPEPELFCLDVDLTERKRTEALVKKLSLAVEQSPSSIVITDIYAMIEYVNAAFLANSGYTQEEVIGKNPRILQSGNTPREVFTDMWQTLTRGEVWKGEMENRRKDGVLFTEYVVVAPLRQPDGRTSHYVAIKENVTKSKQDKEVINTLAYYDVLTGLPNRRFLLERLQHAVIAYSRNRREAALILIDIDHFNRVNDAYGHDAGDQLLRQMALRLKACLRESDTIARPGGDEFLILLENLSDQIHEAAAQAKSVCETILKRIVSPHFIDEAELNSTVSIGITLFSGSSDADDVLRRADLAMYQAKSAGRNTLRFFDPEMQEAVTKRALLEADLRDALQKSQFFLHYQPQIRYERITGAEVLIRWSHPLRGSVSPAEFIPVAEEGPLILSIGHWVLQTACKKLCDWSNRPGFEDLTLSVNISARQFKEADFVDQVIAVLRRHGTRPERLKLELTENLLLDNIEDTISKMKALKSLGVSFALDDFGTGYSSLSYLKRLPLDQLKIDQGFVRDILHDSNDAAIARMVIALGNSMGLEVIAEGVESADQKTYLAEQGCLAYQGYFFGRPVQADQFEQQVEAWDKDMRQNE